MNSPGRSAQSSLMLINDFNSPTLLALSIPLTWRTIYQGKLPFTKYSSTYPIDSKSSLLDNSIPLCALRLAYLVVPTNYFFSF